MRYVLGIDGSIVDLDDKDIKRCCICSGWFQRHQMRNGSYCTSCNNDYQRWRNWVRRVDQADLYYSVRDTGVQTFRGLYMSGMLSDEDTINGHARRSLRPWVDKWQPGRNDEVVPSGAVALPQAQA